MQNGSASINAPSAHGKIRYRSLASVCSQNFATYSTRISTPSSGNEPAAPFCLIFKCALTHIIIHDHTLNMFAHGYISLLKKPDGVVGLLTFTPVIAFAFYLNSDYYRINRIFPTHNVLNILRTESSAAIRSVFLSRYEKKHAGAYRRTRRSAF